MGSCGNMGWGSNRNQAEGVGFGVWGLGFMVFDLGSKFWVEGLGFQISGFGFRVQGLGLRFRKMVSWASPALLST